MEKNPESNGADPNSDDQIEDNEDDDSLTLSLSPFPRHAAAVPPGRGRMRRNPTTTPPPGKPATITPPYSWAGNLRANVRSLEYILSLGIFSITGEVCCKRCGGTYRMEFDLVEKFREVAAFIDDNLEEMNCRAPRSWMSPALLNCQICNHMNSVRPVIPQKKQGINWLFMFLGQTVGCCTLRHLKYFLKHNKIHRTGAKDRLVFSAYLEIYQQLRADGKTLI
ncbi:hypothetical protein ACS0TY_025747 [Phlomoides rotata]